ncbi:MAG: hypothetical protein RBG13Loki_2652 [Promethearchaeota archaeon CR_4]|nr:MAG: hypothetical protein RBG13Loki_2652 [Candidatus Lokiarchaeota archaeon CR_4]
MELIGKGEKKKLIGGNWITIPMCMREYSKIVLEGIGFWKDFAVVPSILSPRGFICKNGGKSLENPLDGIGKGLR